MDGRLIACVSTVALEEIKECSAEKRAKLLEYLNGAPITYLDETDETVALTDKYIEEGVLSSAHRDDCRHIAVATINKCDYIASWNFRHFVNVRTKDRVRDVNEAAGYRNPQIVAPPELLPEEES